jgi:hypothetical protein
MIFAAIFAMNKDVVCCHEIPLVWDNLPNLIIVQILVPLFLVVSLISGTPQRSLGRIDQRSAKLVLLFRCEIREGQSPLVPPAPHLGFSGARPARVQSVVAAEIKGL